MRTSSLSALAEPNRRRIVELLRAGPRPVGEIAARLRLRQPQVSKHLRVLTRAGFVQARPVAQRRIYHLQPKPFKELDSWLGTFRRLWEGRLDTLDEYLQELKAEQGRGRR
jgi:DNA-binding transcriptional ArsR family regulator